MRFLLRLSGAIDSLNDRLGKGGGWLTLGMVLIGAFNTMARYSDRYTGGQLSSNAYLEMQWYLFTLVFLLGSSYAFRRDAHVRVDVLYGRLSERGRAWIDLVGTLVLLLPFCLFSLWASWPSVRNAWAVREVSSDPGGLARYPIKSVVLVAFALLILQGCSQIIKQLAVLLGLRQSPVAGATQDTLHV